MVSKLFWHTCIFKIFLHNLRRAGHFFFLLLIKAEILTSSLHSKGQKNAKCCKSHNKIVRVGIKYSSVLLGHYIYLAAISLALFQTPPGTLWGVLIWVMSSQRVFTLAVQKQGGLCSLRISTSARVLRVFQWGNELYGISKVQRKVKVNGSRSPFVLNISFTLKLTAFVYSRAKI